MDLDLFVMGTLAVIDSTSVYANVRCMRTCGDFCQSLQIQVVTHSNSIIWVSSCAFSLVYAAGVICLGMFLKQRVSPCACCRRVVRLQTNTQCGKGSFPWCMAVYAVRAHTKHLFAVSARNLHRKRLDEWCIQSVLDL